MTEATFAYWNKLADQTIFISSLLGGFSIAVVANFLVSDLKTKLVKYIMACSTLAASFFLVAVFAMTRLLLLTTEGYPFEVSQDDLFLPRLLGAVTFYLGMVSLISVISLSGWTKSKRMGWFTTVVGIITLLTTLMMTS